MTYYKCRNIVNPFSMSFNARCAYENGEMPQSRWLKRVMLLRLACALDLDTEDYANDFDDELLAEYEDIFAGGNVYEVEKPLDVYEWAKRQRKDYLFNNLLAYVGWHHVGKFADEVAFYGITDVSMRWFVDAFKRSCEPGVA